MNKINCRSIYCRVAPNSRQPAELTGYLGRLCWLLLWFIYFFKDKLFVPLLVQIYENETYFSLQFVDLKIIWLAQRYTIISSLHWALGITCINSGLETNGSQLVRRLVEIPFWLVSRSAFTFWLMKIKALKHRMETKLSIPSDDWIPKANWVSRILKLIL